jgi:hypothetical protein
MCVYVCVHVCVVMFQHSSVVVPISHPLPPLYTSLTLTHLSPHQFHPCPTTHLIQAWDTPWSPLCMCVQVGTFTLTILTHLYYDQRPIQSTPLNCHPSPLSLFVCLCIAVVLAGPSRPYTSPASPAIVGSGRAPPQHLVMIHP